MFELQSYSLQTTMNTVGWMYIQIHYKTVFTVHQCIIRIDRTYLYNTKCQCFHENELGIIDLQLAKAFFSAVNEKINRGPSKIHYCIKYDY